MYVVESMDFTLGIQVYFVCVCPLIAILVAASASTLSDQSDQSERYDVDSLLNFFLCGSVIEETFCPDVLLSLTDTFCHSHITHQSTM